MTINDINKYIISSITIIRRIYMINKKLENLKVMGFAKFKKKADVELHDVIASSIKWQEGFLAEIEGISFATMLMNTKGELADVIFAKD